MNMDAISPFILSLVTFIPAGGGLLILLIPRRDRDIKLFALVISMLAFIASLHLPVHLHRESGAFGYEIDKIWIASPNIHYHMGIDGISVWLVVLTTFLAPLRVDLLDLDSRARERIFHSAADSGVGADRRLHLT